MKCLVQFHGDADVRGAQRGCVVRAVADHRDIIAPPLQRIDDRELLLRLDAREDTGRGAQRIERAG